MTTVTKGRGLQGGGKAGRVQATVEISGRHRERESAGPWGRCTHHQKAVPGQFHFTCVDMTMAAELECETDGCVRALDWNFILSSHKVNCFSEFSV